MSDDVERHVLYVSYEEIERKYKSRKKYTAYVSFLCTIALFMLIPSQVTELLATRQVRGLLAVGLVIGLPTAIAIDMLLIKLNEWWRDRCKAHALFMEAEYDA